MIVATMARVVTSVTAFVSTMSPASANRARPPTPTTKERVNVLTATTRLTRSSLQSVGSCLRRPSVRSSPARQARPYWERPARAKWRNGESASTGIAQEKRQSSVTIPVLECSLVQTGHRCTAPNAYPRKAAEGRAPLSGIGANRPALERLPGMVGSGARGGRFWPGHSPDSAHRWPRVRGGRRCSSSRRARSASSSPVGRLGHC